MTTFEFIEDEAQAKRIAGILDGTTQFASQTDRLAALAVAAFESHGVESMLQLVIEERLSSWGLTIDAAAAAVKAALNTGLLMAHQSGQSVHINLT